MTIELHQHTAFEETEPDMPEWMRGRRAEDYAPTPRLVFPAPIRDPALVGYEPDYMRYAVDPGQCPECFELIDGPECPHDWAAIAAEAQQSIPTIHLRINGG